MVDKENDSKTYYLNGNQVAGWEQQGDEGGEQGGKPRGGQYALLVGCTARVLHGFSLVLLCPC